MFVPAVTVALKLVTLPSSVGLSLKACRPAMGSSPTVRVTQAVLLILLSSRTVEVTPVVLVITPGVIGAVARMSMLVGENGIRLYRVQVTCGRAEISHPGAETPVRPSGRVSVTVAVGTGLGPLLLTTRV